MGPKMTVILAGLVATSRGQNSWVLAITEAKLGFIG